MHDTGCNSESMHRFCQRFCFVLFYYGYITLRSTVRKKPAQCAQYYLDMTAWLTLTSCSACVGWCWCHYGTTYAMGNRHIDVLHTNQSESMILMLIRCNTVYSTLATHWQRLYITCTGLLKNKAASFLNSIFNFVDNRRNNIRSWCHKYGWVVTSRFFCTKYWIHTHQQHTNLHAVYDTVPRRIVKYH